MTRRAFLRLAAGAVIVGGLVVSPLSPLPWRLLGSGEARGIALAERLRVALRSAGVRAMPAPPDDLSPARAAVDLMGQASLREVDLLCEDADALLAYVSARSEADLATRRTRLVDGWLLSETDVRVSVLLASGVTP